MSFTNKTVVITGGAKGIGAGCASVFYREGANVAILDVDDKTGSKFVDELGERALFVKCNISKENEVQDAVEKIDGHFGSIDYLVNNAGILKYYSVTNTSEEDWDAVMNVNLKGAFLCAKHCIPYMQKNNGGVVVNMSSVQAFVAQENVAAYITTKSALVGLTRSIAVDYAPNIRSVAICPGGVDTPMNRKAFQESPDPEIVRKETENLHLNGRMATEEEIGELVAFVCSEKGSFINGQPIRIDGGLGIKVGGSKKE
ncbi:MAG: glucose 1-dehydrogenase [Balneolaceae bacterium]|nr:glucose 1-dehydrogenase [Balneolaceae bacterium]